MKDGGRAADLEDGKDGFCFHRGMTCGEVNVCVPLGFASSAHLGSRAGHSMAPLSAQLGENCHTHVQLDGEKYSQVTKNYTQHYKTLFHAKIQILIELVD